MKTTILHTIHQITSKIKWQQIIAFVMLMLAFVFFQNEKKEIKELLPHLRSANTFWILMGLLSGVFYIFLQALMYVYSFRAVGQKISIWDATDLFLKRNLISIFLPAGGITSLIYLPKNIKKKDIPNGAIHQASSIYGFIGILSVFIVGIPLIIYATSINTNFGKNSWALVIIGLLLLGLYLIYHSLKNKGLLYRLSQKYAPKLLTNIQNVVTGSIDRKFFYITILVSIIIECCGVLQIVLAMQALGSNVSFSAAALAYIISVILMMVSPFLRGLGAVEFSLSYILTNFGFRHSEGLGITLLYRLFEFWLPLLLGILSYFWNGRKLLARLIPALLIFALGIINILSVITPPIANRLALNEIYFPITVIHFSKILTIITGVLLLFTAAYLIKGYRRAWFVAIALSLFSIIGNLVKALDYEEATFSIMVLLLLVYTRNEYKLSTKKFSFLRGFSWFAMFFIAVVIINFLTFYFIHPIHFGVNFTWKQSLYYTLQTFLFFKNNGLTPYTNFAKDFQYLNNFLGIMSWSLLIYSFYKASTVHQSQDEENYDRANILLNKYGTSALDYFKQTEDKQFYFAQDFEGFVSYRNYHNFAVVLEEPVCANEFKDELITAFENFCHQQGLRTCYYRVDENSIALFKTHQKKHLLIGQEGIVDVKQFSLEGKDKKALRNVINSLEKKAYHCAIIEAPHSAEILDDLQTVSNEWLQAFDKKEMVFAEGVFDREIIAQQDVILLRDEGGKPQAFLNIIPDYSPNECTYDLIRRTENSPNGSMDILILRLIDYAKSKNLQFINLGLAPMSGIDHPDNTAEELMKFAYNKVSSFKHYQSLRFFKEKYANYWTNKYIVYSSDVDFIQLIRTLNQIMKP